MKRFAHLVTPAWLIGLVLAGAGIVLARFVAPALAGAWQPGVKVAGELIAFGGLLVIAAGVSRRVHRGSAP